jgi:hypothetical protein
MLLPSFAQNQAFFRSLFSRAKRGQKELGFTGCGKTPAWQ